MLGCLCWQALQKYGIDLTAKVAVLDPVIGRDEEIRRCIRVLCRRTKNNPVLIGDPGVGKTAIVEGLAQRVVSLLIHCCHRMYIHSKGNALPFAVIAVSPTIINPWCFVHLPRSEQIMMLIPR